MVILFMFKDFPFMWRAQTWSECSKRCGSGTQTRDFICAKKDGKKQIESKCTNSLKPESKRLCYGKKCSRLNQNTKYALLPTHYLQVINQHATIQQLPAKNSNNFYFTWYFPRCWLRCAQRVVYILKQRYFICGQVYVQVDGI